MKIGEFMVTLVRIGYRLLAFLIFGASITALLFILCIEELINGPWEYYLIFGIGVLLLFMDIMYLESSALDTIVWFFIKKTWFTSGCALILIGSMIFIYHYGIHHFGIPREKLEKNHLNTPITAPKLENTDTSPTSTLPPTLSIGRIEFSENPLKANETATLSIPIKNIGRGDAKDLTVHLKSDFQGLSFPPITKVPPIPKKTGQQIVDIHVKGTSDLPTGKTKIEIYIDEPHFKQRIPPFKPLALSFHTWELPTPKLVLVNPTVVEKESAHPNEKIDLNEVIELQFYVQNQGVGDAKEVKVQVDNRQVGVSRLRTDEITPTWLSPNAIFPEIKSGEDKVVKNIYTYLINSEFKDRKLLFEITVTEKHGDYGFLETEKFPINKKLKPLGKITPVSIDDEAPSYEKPVIEERPPLKSSGNILWIRLVIVVCCGSLFIIIWKRRRRGKQTKPSDSDQRQKKLYEDTAGKKESIN